MAPPAVPPRDVILSELARRHFEDWTRYHFSILDKNGHHTYLVLNQVQRAIEAHETQMLRERGEAKLYVLKARQGGVTTHQQAKSLNTTMQINGARALTLAHDRDSTDKIFAITQYAVDNFRPGYMPELGKKQTKEFSFPQLNSRFYTGTAGARRTGRGLTLRRLHASEFAFWDDPKTTLNSVMPALIPTGSVAVLETTASGFDTVAHRYWRDAKQGANAFRPLFFAWWECDLVHYQLPLLDPEELGPLDDEEALLVAERGLTLEQIKWRRKKMLDMGGKDEFLQEYPEDDESCWLAVGGMYYAAKDLRILQQKVPRPSRTDLGGELEIYAEPNGERVIIGADTAEGVGADRSTFVARAFPSWRLLRTYASSRVQPKEFAGILNAQGRELGAAYQVIEKNMHGITVLRHLRDDHQYPVSQLYHRVPLDQAMPEASTRIGWATTEESKAIMLGAGRELLTAALQGLAGVPCASVITDAFAVRRGDNGKFNLNGRDMLVAEMLCWIGRSAPTGQGMLDWLREQAEAAKSNATTAPGAA